MKKYAIGFIAIAIIVIFSSLCSGTIYRLCPLCAEYLPLIISPGFLIATLINYYALGNREGICPPNTTFYVSILFSVIFYFSIYAGCLKIYSTYKKRSRQTTAADRYRSV